jgi:hypothetical protein
MTTDSSRYLSDLHKQIDRLFNLEEVRTLCFDLGVDFDNVAGEGKSARIRELILQLARRDELPRLIDLVRQERPNAVWTGVPANFSLPGGLETPEKTPPATANYYGPVTFNQQGQVVHGLQANIAGDAHINHIGDKIEGDRITVGNISGSSGIAIGRGAQATVTTTTVTGGDPALVDLFAPLRALAASDAPDMAARVAELEAHAARGAAADDAAMAGLIQDLADADPVLKAAVAALFARPELATAAGGGATKFVLSRL